MLKDSIRQEFNQARKDKDTVKKSALEAVLAGILLKEKSGQGEVGDDAVIECLVKEIKVQREIEELWRVKDASKSAEANSKIATLETFMPRQMTDEEVLVLVREADSMKENSPRAKGCIIKAIMPQLGGKYEKSKVNGLVEKYLNDTY